MTRTTYPGGWYPDATPDGQFCVALLGQQKVMTNFGMVSTAPRDLLYTRCPAIGAFRFCGQEGDRPNHQGDGNYEYPAGVRVGNSISVSPVLYDLAGKLVQATASHQGYRYVEHSTGRIYTGDETYGPFNGLFEYSEAGDGLYVGQAAYDNGGVQVWDGSALRQLELGVAKNVRVQWDDSGAVAIAFATNDSAIIYQTTQAELHALPLVVPPVPPDPIPPDPVPPDPIPPDPEPIPPEPVPPEPQPEPPDGGPIMVYIDLRKPNMAAEKCEEIDNGNGTKSYRKVSNGKILCVNPQGGFEERDDPGGPWESFYRTGNALVADRDWNDTIAAYLLPYAEVK